VSLSVVISSHFHLEEVLAANFEKEEMLEDAKSEKNCSFWW
jgi:hypothetical protein